MKLIGYHDLIPIIQKGNVAEARQEYLKQVAKSVPKFLTYIEMFDYFDGLGGVQYKDIKATKNPGLCSGSLISFQYVLTAGHCICNRMMPYLPCRPDHTGQIVLKYDIYQHMILWIGLDSSSLEMRYTNFDYIVDCRYRASRGFLHPNFNQSGAKFQDLVWDTHDIGLIQLKTPVCKGPLIGPASLPLGWRADLVNDGDLPSREEFVFAMKVEDKPGEDSQNKYQYQMDGGTIKLKEAYLAGYGIPRERGTCRTWDGRSPLQKCKFPFKVKVSPENKGLFCKLADKTFNKCIRVIDEGILPPDYTQNVCRQLESIWPKTPDGSLNQFTAIGTNNLHNILRMPFQPGLMRPEFFSSFSGLFQVVDENQNCTAECITFDSLYRNQPFYIARYGWCATCDPEAKRGQPNYCGYDMATESDDPERFAKEMGVAEPGKNWGFCSNECEELTQQQFDPKFTGVGLISYLSDEHCQRLLNGYLDSTNEFCAGNLVTEQKRRFRIRNNKPVEIDPLVPWENLTYVGGFQSGAKVCGGDSGGPIFLPVVVEMENMNLTDEDLVHLASTRRTLNNRTEGEILSNIFRDPILIGVTRRTVGCGIKDQPPIFGKVWKYMDWIMEIIADSQNSTTNCSSDMHHYYQKKMEPLASVLFGRGAEPHKRPSSSSSAPMSTERPTKESRTVNQGHQTIPIPPEFASWLQNVDVEIDGIIES